MAFPSRNFFPQLQLSTGVEKRASSLFWRIENMRWGPEYFQGIESPCFKLLNIGTCRLFLRLKGENDEDQILNCRLWFSENISSLDYEWKLFRGDGASYFTRRIRNVNIKCFKCVDLFDWRTYEEVTEIKRSLFFQTDTLYLECRFWNPDMDFKQAEYISAYTRIKGAEKSYFWRIKKFSSLQLEQELITPFVLKFPDEEVTFKLKFSLKGNSLSDAVVSLEIILKTTSVMILTANLSILDPEHRTIKSTKSKHYLKPLMPDVIICSPKLVSRQEIMDRKADWLNGDDLTLLCQFESVKEEMEYGISQRLISSENLKSEIPENKQSVRKIASIETKITDPTCTISNVPKQSSQNLPLCSDGNNISQYKTKSVASLQDDFLSLYTDHTLSDFELRSGDASIPVHKNVLSSRSPVFKAMFCGEMKETDSLDVPDLDFHTLNRMLTFMYTGTLDHLDWENAAKLYYAAKKYQVQSLKEECLHQLQTGTTVQNVSDILELADKQQDKDLELLVHDFIVSHYDEVVPSEEWAKFLKSNAALAGNVMRDAYRKRLQMDCN